MILPRKNAKDLEEVPKNASNDMRVALVDTMDEVLAAALASTPAPLSSPNVCAVRPRPAKRAPRRAMPLIKPVTRRRAGAVTPSRSF